MKEAIAEPLRVFGAVVELIDTQDNIFTFKYKGPIRERIGMEAWARMLIKEAYPDTVEVSFVTNRVRDNRDQ